MIHEFVVLSQHCLEGGTEAMERMVQSRLVSDTFSSFCDVNSMQ